MPYVVTSKCLGAKHIKCIDVCPADCFHDAGDILVIDPNRCTNCAACVNICPEKAIFKLENVPESEKDYIQINAEKSKTSPQIIPNWD